MHMHIREARQQVGRPVSLDALRSFRNRYTLQGPDLQYGLVLHQDRLMLEDVLPVHRQHVHVDERDRQVRVSGVRPNQCQRQQHAESRVHGKTR